MNEKVTPLVSVVIPTYNYARYLGRALQSVLDQTYTNWEAIVIDNHSTDNTDEVMASCVDPRITYLKIHNNGVIAASRNMGIKAAKGEWVAFLDSDDWWSVGKIETCLNYIDDNVDLIYHDLEIAYDKLNFFRRSSRKVKSPVLKDLLFRGNAISNSSVIVRKKLLTKIGGINEDIRMIAAEDYNTWLRIATITDAFKYIPKPLGVYEVHLGGASQCDISIPHLHAIKDFCNDLTSRELSYIEKHIKYIAGRYRYLKKEYSAAEGLLREALSLKRPILSLKSLYMLLVISLKNS